MIAFAITLDLSINFDYSYIEVLVTTDVALLTPHIPLDAFSLGKQIAATDRVLIVFMETRVPFDLTEHKSSGDTNEHDM